MDLNGINVVVLRLVRIFLNLKLHWFLNCICLSGSRWWSLCAELDTIESKSWLDHISGIFSGLLRFDKRNETNRKYEHLLGVLCWIFTMFAKRSNPLLYLKEGLRHLAIKCKCKIWKNDSVRQFPKCQASMFVVDE